MLVAVLPDGVTYGLKGGLMDAVRELPGSCLEQGHKLVEVPWPYQYEDGSQAPIVVCPVCDEVDSWPAGRKVKVVSK